VPHESPRLSVKRQSAVVPGQVVSLDAQNAAVAMMRRPARNASWPGTRSAWVSHRLGSLFCMDLQMMLKDAALLGLAVGVFVMAAVLLWEMGAYLLKPATTVAAAVAKPPFGFCRP